MKYALLTLILLPSLASAPRTRAADPQAEQNQVRVQFIDFYGYTGLDVDRVRAALPVHEGDTFPSPASLKDARARIEEAVRRATGRPPTAVSFISPGRDLALVYVGLSGRNMRGFPFNP